MNIEITLPIFLSFITSSITLTTHYFDPCFTAAVYEHKRIVGDNLNEYEKILRLNIIAYWNAATIAAKNGADIIIFPEAGLFPYVEDRHLLSKFLDFVPNDGTNPCNEWTNSSISVVKSLSCMAKKNDIYLSAHIGEIEDDNHYFSTSIIIDNKGVLIAKYRKYNLYFESNFHKTKKPGIVVKSTQLGCLGIIICFDGLHYEPISSLLKKKIDTLIYSSWWYDEMPFLTSLQEQFAISLIYDINLLAAGGNNLKTGTLGSSIFSRFSSIYTHDIKRGGSKLLISKIPKRRNILKPHLCNKTLEIPIGIHEEEEYNYLQLNLHIFKQIKLNETSKKLKLCENGFCCTVEYNANSLRYAYYFILTKRIRDYLGICEEMCGIVVYNIEESNYQLTKGDIFRKIYLKGNFETYMVFPTVLSNNMELVLNNWQYTNVKINNTYISKMSILNNNIPINVFGLYGRCFNKDPVKEN